MRVSIFKKRNWQLLSVWLISKQHIQSEIISTYPVNITWGIFRSLEISVQGVTCVRQRRNEQRQRTTDGGLHCCVKQQWLGCGQTHFPGMQAPLCRLRFTQSCWNTHSLRLFTNTLIKGFGHYSTKNSSPSCFRPCLSNYIISFFWRSAEAIWVMDMNVQNCQLCAQSWRDSFKGWAK